MTMTARPNPSDSTHFGPLKPAGTRLAHVLGELKTVSDKRCSPVYDVHAAPAEGAIMPTERQIERKTRAAFEAILAPHMDELYGAAMRLTRSPSDADDVLQDAMARAWTFWDRFEAGTNVRAWMHRILYNTFVNGYRRAKREREVLAEVHANQSVLKEDRATMNEALDGLGDEVSEALRQLPARFRVVVESVDLRGESYRDAAQAIGCPVGTIMSRLHRGRRLLKEQLRPYAASEGYVAAA